MRYFGSKVSTLEAIENIVDKHFLSGMVCDPFGGIGTVSTFFKKKGYSVTSGDTLKFAHCFQVARIAINNMQCLKNISLNSINDRLNSLPICDGWFTQYYAVERKYFTLENAKKIQSCIDTIWNWHDNKFISDIEYSLLIASLINSMDQVANTAGTYYAYLKNFSRKATRTFNYQIINPVITHTKGQSLLSDAIDLVNITPCDILYLDPPYNERNYVHYYHLPETIATKTIPSPKGLSGIHNHDYEKSAFSKKNTACEAFSKLIQNAKCKLLIFHYSDIGIIPKENILSNLQSLGKIYDTYCTAKGYSTDGKNTSSEHHIYWMYIE